MGKTNITPLLNGLEYTTDWLDVKALVELSAVSFCDKLSVGLKVWC